MSKIWAAVAGVAVLISAPGDTKKKKDTSLPPILLTIPPTCQVPGGGELTLLRELVECRVRLGICVSINE